MASAEIIVERENKKETIAVQFNPHEYEIVRSVVYSKPEGIAPESGSNDYAASHLPGRDDGNFKAQILFDGFIKAGTMLEEKAADIAKDLKQIKALTEIDPKLHKPPICTFHWGALFYRGVITETKEKYTMFSSDGKLLRATMDLTIDRRDDGKLATESPDRTKRRVVMEGTQICMLAEEAYHDSAKWRFIASANGVKNPRKLPYGSALVIPPLDKDS
jgi:hypothetical protein